MTVYSEGDYGAYLSSHKPDEGRCPRGRGSQCLEI